MKCRFAMARSVVALTLLVPQFTSASRSLNRKEPAITRTTIVARDIESVEVTGNFTIILMPEFADRIVVTGTVKQVNKISTTYQRRSLCVKASGNVHAQPATILVSARQLCQLRVNGNAVVTSRNQLTIPHLQIYLNGESTVNILSSGQIEVNAAADYELTKMQKTIRTVKIPQVNRHCLL